MDSFLVLILLVVSSCNVDGQSIIWMVPTSGDGSCGEVAETSTPGTLAITITALAPSFNQQIVSYNVTNQPIGSELSFTVEGLGNGLAVLESGSIDFEAGPSMVFTVIAIDSSTPTALTGTATCTVNVTDINDNVPVFSVNPYITSVADNSAEGTTVAVYTASDADGSTPNNDVITYTITDGNSNSDMEMAASSGIITVAPGRSLQRTATSTYTLTVTAKDGGVPELTGTGTLTVCVGGCENMCSKLQLNTSLVLITILFVLNKTF